jgi:hypothetical protein
MVGFGIGGLAFVEACVRIALGDANADDTGTVVQGVMGGLLLVFTVVGRQWQAGKATEATATVEAAKAHAVTYNSMAVGTLAPTLEGEPVDPGREFPSGSVPTGLGPEAVERLRP